MPETISEKTAYSKKIRSVEVDKISRDQVIKGPCDFMNETPDSISPP